MNNGNWSKEEIEILKKHNQIDILLELLPNRNEKGIRIKASRLGISIPREDLWNEDEIDIILNNLHLPLSGLCLLLPYRTKYAIQTRIQILGKKLIRNSSLWTYNEKNILKNNQHKTIKELSKLLPNRTMDCIRSKVLSEGYTYRNEYDVIENSFKCIRCGVVKEYNDENFDLKNNRKVCRECRQKISQKAKYKMRHNIYLDSKKGIYTYSPFEWYDFFYENQIGKLPFEIRRNQKNMSKIVRYAITKYLNKKTREDLLSITSYDFSSLKLHNLLSNSSIFNILNDAFPEYKIFPWELQSVPDKFWEVKTNADDYMKWWVENNLDLENILDINNEIPKIFSVNSLRQINEHKLNRCLQENEHYQSYYEWISELFPKWNLTENDFRENIANDGSRLDSQEELKVYEYIKDVLELSVKPIGKSRDDKYKFYNKKCNESYIPDFIMEHELDKPLIIEYFGLARCQQNGIFKGYIEKTVRKIEYFNLEQSVYFIDLYPEDLNDNYLGIKNKFSSFLFSNDGGGE